MHSSRAARRRNRPRIAADWPQESAGVMAALPSEDSDEPDQKRKRRQSAPSLRAACRRKRPRAVNSPQESAPVAPRASWVPGAASVLPSEGSDEQHPQASWTTGAAAVLPSESSDEQHPRASWKPGAAAVLPSESSDEQLPRASWTPGAAAVLPSESRDEQPCHQLCESSDDEQPCKIARSSGSRTARPRRQPQLARYVPEQSGASTRLPSESSESGNDAVDAHARKANMRQGLVSTTAHGPCTLAEVQGIFMWPRDAYRAATATLKNPHDPGSFLNRPVVMATNSAD